MMTERWLPPELQETLSYIGGLTFYGNRTGTWALAVFTAAITLSILPLVRRATAQKAKRWEGLGRLHYGLDLATLMVARTHWLFPWAVAIWLGSKHLNLPAILEDSRPNNQWHPGLLAYVIVIAFWAQVALWAMGCVRFMLEVRRKHSTDLDTLLSGSMDVIVAVAGIAIWSMATLLVLETLGIRVQPLIAGLGISGIAVALAVQTVLSDLFASMSIALDRPFMVGDFLTLGDAQGTVEHIGVKSTRLRALSGEQIIMSNADILKTRVRNFGRMRERRIVFQFGLAYETDSRTVASIPEVVREIIAQFDDARYDRCHFLNYTENALQFEAVYFVKSSDYNKYADIQHRINLDLLEHLRERGVRFCSPSRTVVDVERLPRGLQVET